MGRKKKNTETKENISLDELDNISDEESEIDIDNNQLNALQQILQVSEKNPTEWNRLKFVFYATILFAILSLPFIDKIYQLIFSNSSSWLILISMKIITFFVLYYIIVYLNKK